jgi:diguanylate cyclase (GGDEF)-like protein
VDSQTQHVLAAVAQIWERSKETIFGRVAVLEQAIRTLSAGILDDALRQRAEQEAHKLTGSLGTFGFAQGSRLARELEQALRTGGPFDQVEAARLSALVVALRHELEQPLAVQSSTSPDPTPVAAEKRPLLLLLTADAELAEQLAEEAVARGMRTSTAPALFSAREAISRERPDVVLLDLSLSESSEGSLEFLSELSIRTPPVPALVLTARNAFVDRVEVARHGGRGFLQKPLPPAQIIETVAQFLAQYQTAEALVLAVDDDPQVLDLLRALLAPRGIALTTLSDPLRFWDVLQETSPDLLMLDVDMPNLNGIELCQVVRNDQRWAGMPVLFLTAHTDADTIHRVFAAGADDFVGKPIVGPELLTRITNRLERSRLLRALAETDALTGVANRHKSTQVIEHFLSLANRQQQPFCLALLDIDHFKRVNDRYGHATGDEVLRRLGDTLRRAFRGEDVVARWGGEEFVVGMYGMHRDDGVQRLAEMLEVWRQEEFSGNENEHFRVTFSAGVAEYPADGTDLLTLYRAADRALYQAKAAGRNRVLPAGWQPEKGQGEQRADVVLVDDDETLAGLLLPAMQTRGHRTYWLKDGREALEALGGAHPRLRARVLLLDVNLPGLDGLSLLKRLAEEHVTQDTRIIMLTAQSADTDIVTTLEAGAFDHVAKPFSLPVLLQRIRRALQV